MSTPRVLTVVQVGAGLWGRSWAELVSGWRGSQLVGLVDASREARDWAQERLGVRAFRTLAQALASHARGELEAALGPLFVARTGRHGCAELDLLLDGWDGQLTGSTRKLVSRHIEQCAACDDRSHGALRAALCYGMAPLAPLPPELRDEVLGLCTDSSPETLSYRRGVAQRAGAFLPNGFPQAIRAPRRRMIALSGAAAVVGVLR